MKRISLLGAAIAMAVAAAPASAGNSGTEGGGPPTFSGNAEKTFVYHCKAEGANGTIVFQQRKDATVGGCK